MVYAILLLFLFIVAISTRNIKNRYTLQIMGMSIALTLIIVSHIFLIAKRGNYPQTQIWLLKYDYKMYLLLAKVRISYKNIFVLNSIGVALFCGMQPLFITSYLNYKHKRQYVSTFLFMISFPILYLILYSPSFSYRLYMALYFSKIGYDNVAIMIKTIDIMMHLFMFLCLVIPIILLFKYASKQKSLFLKRRTYVISVCLLMLNSMFIIIYFGPIKRINFSTLQITQSLLKQSFHMNYFALYNEFIPILMLVSMIVMFMLLVYYKVIDTVDITRGLVKNEPLLQLTKNLQKFMHTMKNDYFSQKLLIEKIENNYGETEGLKALQKLKQINGDKISEISRALEATRPHHFRRSVCNVTDCIDKAVDKFVLPKHINIVKNIDVFQCYTYFKKYQLIEVFVNIIQNSVTAIQGTKQPSGCIWIDLFIEHNMIIIKVRDNGSGIKKENLKYIFDPLFTTKSLKYNWGLGLSFVQNAIKTQSGIISVQTEEKKGTSFEIVLPSIKDGLNE